MTTVPEAVAAFRMPPIYFNGFEIGLSNSDVVCNLSLANAPTTSLYMSFTTAKTLAEKLNEIVQHLERVTEREIMTSEKVAVGLEKLMQETQG